MYDVRKQLLNLNHDSRSLILAEPSKVTASKRRRAAKLSSPSPSAQRVERGGRRGAAQAKRLRES